MSNQKRWARHKPSWQKASYATLKTSTCFNKKCSETVWFYMNGNRDKVDRYIQTPQDAIALCAVLFSEVIRYPDMFFSQHPPDAALEVMGGVSWQSSHVDRRIMERWIKQARPRDWFQKRFKQREEKNLFSCVKNIMRRQEKRGTLFHSAPENEEARNWCQLCFYFSVCKIPLSFFSAPETPWKKSTIVAQYLRKIKITCLNDRRARCSDTHLEQGVLRSSSETTSALCCLPHWTHYNLHTAETVPQTTLYCLHPAHCSLPPGNKNTYVRMLFVDYSSAFNTIVPATLVEKLQTLGLNRSLCSWILDFLTGRSQVVRMGNNTSSPLILNTGAPAGLRPQPTPVLPVHTRLYSYTQLQRHRQICRWHNGW